MAARNPKPPTIPLDADAELATASDLELKLAQYFDELGAGDAEDLTIGIYEINPEDRRRMGFLFYIEPGIPAHELLDDVLKEYGPGEYAAICRNATELRFTQRFVVGSTKKMRPRVPPNPERAPPPATSSSSIDPNVAAILAGQQRILEALAARPTEAPKSTVDLLRELTAAKELLTPAPAQAQQATPLSEVFSIVRDVLSLKDELSGGDEGSDPLTTAIKTLGPSIVKAVEALQNAPRLGAQRHDLSPGRDVSGDPPMQQPAGIGRLIGPYMPIILSNARGGVLPADAARQILMQISGLGDEHKISLLDWLDDEAAVDKLAALDRAVLDLRDWFEQLVDVLIVSLQHELELEPDTDPGPVPVASLGRDVGEWPRPGLDSSAPPVAGSNNAAKDTPTRLDDA